MNDLSLEGVGNIAVFEATLYSMLDGAGSETCDHIIMSLLTYLFQQLNGEMIIIFIFDGVLSFYDEQRKKKRSSSRATAATTSIK